MNQKYFYFYLLFLSLFFTVFSQEIEQVYEHQLNHFKIKATDEINYKIFKYKNEHSEANDTIVISFLKATINYLIPSYKLFVYYSETDDPNIPKTAVSSKFSNPDIEIPLGSNSYWEYRISDKNPEFNKNGYFYFCLVRYFEENYETDLIIFNTGSENELFLETLNFFRLTGSYFEPIKFKIPKTNQRKFLFFSFESEQPRNGYAWELKLTSEEKEEIIKSIPDTEPLSTFITIEPNSEYFLTFDTAVEYSDGTKAEIEEHIIKILFSFKEDFKENLADNHIVTFTALSNMNYFSYYDISALNEDDSIFLQINLSEDYYTEDEDLAKFLFCTQIREKEIPDGLEVKESDYEFKKIKNLRNSYYLLINKIEDMNNIVCNVKLPKIKYDFPSYTLSVIQQENLEINDTDIKLQLKGAQNKYYFLDLVKTIEKYPNSNMLIYSDKVNTISAYFSKFNVATGYNTEIDVGRKMVIIDLKEVQKSYSEGVKFITILFLNLKKYNIHIKIVDEKYKFSNEAHYTKFGYKPEVFEKVFNSGITNILQFHEVVLDNSFIKFCKKLFGDFELKYVNLDENPEKDLDEIFDENFELKESVKVSDPEKFYTDNPQNELIQVKTSSKYSSYIYHIIECTKQNEKTLAIGDFKYVCLKSNETSSIKIPEESNIEINVLGKGSQIDIGLNINNEEKNINSYEQHIRETTSENIEILNKADDFVILELKSFLKEDQFSFIPNNIYNYNIENEIGVLRINKENNEKDYNLFISVSTLARDNSLGGCYLTFATPERITRPPEEVFDTLQEHRFNFDISELYKNKNLLSKNSENEELYLIVDARETVVYSFQSSHYEKDTNALDNILIPALNDSDMSVILKLPKQNQINAVAFEFIPYENTNEIEFTQLVDGQSEAIHGVFSQDTFFHHFDLNHPEKENTIKIQKAFGGGLFRYILFDSNDKNLYYNYTDFSISYFIKIVTSYKGDEKKHYFDIELDNLKGSRAKTKYKYRVLVINQAKGYSIKNYEKVIEMDKSLFDLDKTYETTSDKALWKQSIPFNALTNTSYYVTVIGSVEDGTGFVYKYEENGVTFPEAFEIKEEGSFLIIIIIILVVIILLVVGFLIVRNVVRSKSVNNDYIDVNQIKENSVVPSE